MDAATVLAEAGGTARSSLVGPVAGLDPVEAAAALDALVAGGDVVEVRPGWVRPRGGGAAGPGARALVHRRAFELLAARGELEAAARHALAADAADDPRAAEVVLAAGRAALAAARVSDAVALLRGAVHLRGPAAGAGVLVELGEAELAAGDPSGAADTFGAAARTAASDGERDRARALESRALGYAGQLEEAARAAPVEDGSGALLHATWQDEGPRATLRVLSDLGGARALGATPGLSATAAFVGFWTDGAAGHVDRLEAISTAELEHGVDHLAPFAGPLALASAWIATGREQDALHLCDRALADARRTGVEHAAVTLGTARASALLRLGLLREALLALDVLADGGVIPLMEGPVAAVEAQARAQLGDLDESRTCATAALDGALWMAALGLEAALLHVEVAEGDLEAAGARADAYVARLDALGVGALGNAEWLAPAVDAWSGTGAVGALEDLVRRCGRDARQGPWVAAVALVAEAALAARAGEGDRAEVALAAAAERAEGRLLGRAWVQLHQGEHLRRSGRPATARPHLGQALATAEAAGARPLAARARVALAAAGGRRRTGRSDPRALTPQQSRIAHLAADGLTTTEIADRLVLSPKTIETHLGHVYAKLGVPGRRALRRHLGGGPGS